MGGREECWTGEHKEEVGKIKAKHRCENESNTQIRKIRLRVRGGEPEFQKHGYKDICESPARMLILFHRSPAAASHHPARLIFVDNVSYIKSFYNP